MEHPGQLPVLFTRPLVYLQVVTSKCVLEIFTARCEIHFSVLQVMHCSLKFCPRIFCCTISLLRLMTTLTDATSILAFTFPGVQGCKL
ncbi:hypothetical protein GOODEAATRI_029647 [Goodea atripinnis]|uniref:Uncharacterized protein n=1 Tax=Goodea atripinnis TaxID=208336 RepID=A0ABV0MM90_9TELE